MKQKIVLLSSGLLVVFGILAAPLVAATPVGAIDFLDSACKNDSKRGVCADKDRSKGKKGVKKYSENIINLALYGIGAVSTIVIIIGGILYIVSNGDASRVKLAKDAIVYAVIGLVVALMAFAIVNFVVGKLL